MPQSLVAGIGTDLQRKVGPYSPFSFSLFKHGWFIYQGVFFFGWHCLNMDGLEPCHTSMRQLVNLLSNVLFVGPLGD